MTEPNPTPLTSAASQDLDVLDVVDSAEPTTWKPQHRGHAAWLARVLAKARGTRDLLVEQFDAEIAEIAERKRIAVARHTRRIEWAEQHLIAYAAEHGDEDGRLDLPHATVTARLTPIAIDVTDAAAAIDWLTAHKIAAVRTKSDVALADLKRITVSYGELDATEKSKLIAARRGAEGPVMIDAPNLETGEVEPQAVPGLVASRHVAWSVTT